MKSLNDIRLGGLRKLVHGQARIPDKFKSIGAEDVAMMNDRAKMSIRLAFVAVKSFVEDDRRTLRSVGSLAYGDKINDDNSDNDKRRTRNARLGHAMSLLASKYHDHLDMLGLSREIP